MKECPKCSRVYADDSLRFCLDDGASLRSAGEMPPTIKINAQPTTPFKAEAFSRSPHSAPRKSPVPWVVAALALVFAGFVVLTSVVVMIVNRRSVNANEAPRVSKPATPTPTTSVSLAGTHWTDTYQSLAEKNYYFNPNGTINNSPNSTWQQNGNSVILEFNDHYARYE